MKKTNTLKFNPLIPTVLLTSGLFINNAEANLFSEIPNSVTTQTSGQFVISITDSQSPLNGDTLISPTLIDVATVFGQTLTDPNTFNATIVNLDLAYSSGDFQLCSTAGCTDYGSAVGTHVLSGDVANVGDFAGTGYNTAPPADSGLLPGNGDQEFPLEPGTGTITSNHHNGAFPAIGSGFTLLTDITLPTLPTGAFLYTIDPITFNNLSLATPYPWNSSFTNAGSPATLYLYDPTATSSSFQPYGTITLNISAVPEPEQWLMMLAGFGLIRSYMTRKSSRLQLSVA